MEGERGRGGEMGREMEREWERDRGRDRGRERGGERERERDRETARARRGITFMCRAALLLSLHLLLFFY